MDDLNVKDEKSLAPNVFLDETAMIDFMTINTVIGGV